MELLTTAEMAEADRLTTAGGIPGIELMENAGRAVADHVASRHPPGSRIAVVAGPGNNGGDGFVAARLLKERGYRVRILLVGDVNRLKGDAREAAQRWNASCETASAEALGPNEAIIDALFGAGLDRPVAGTAHAMIEAMNRSFCVHAVDLPSGINGTTGAVMACAVRASTTITFFRRKLGHALLPGRVHCGEIQVAQIGIPAPVLEKIKPQTWINAPALWCDKFPVQQAEGNKYTRGHCIVVSGEMTGAARLAARGALRAGAGLVTIASPRDAFAVNAASNLAVMVRPVNGAHELAEFLADPRRNAVVIGPGVGVGRTTRDMVLACLKGERAVVLDADALTSFAEEPESLFAAVRVRKRETLLTPHEGEFSRLFKFMPDVSNAPSKLARARAAAAKTSAVCLLKGADTVVAAPNGRASICDNAPEWLATAGSGDVLAGFAGGLLAQGMSGFEAASAAVWLHAKAALIAGRALIAEDLPEALPHAIGSLFSPLQPRLMSRIPVI